VTRVRGLASWSPQARTRPWLEAVLSVFDEYESHLPLTIRQLFYRLVATHGYEKTEEAYERLGYMANRARRAGCIPFSAIRDDGALTLVPSGFSGKAGFWEAVASAADEYRRDRLSGQPHALELWVEAAGMAPQLARAIDEYGVAVYSCGGFDSLTAKYDAARRFAEREAATVVLHVGDHDPSGVALFASTSEDVAALTADLDGVQPRFERVAVLPEQIERYGLETSPAKATDRRGAWLGGGTVQAEAFAPDQLTGLVRASVERYVNRDVLEALLAIEQRERTEILDTVPPLQ